MNHLKFSNEAVIGKLVRSAKTEKDYFTVYGAKRPSGEVGDKAPKYVTCGYIFSPSGRNYADLRQEGLKLVDAAFKEEEAMLITRSV